MTISRAEKARRAAAAAARKEAPPASSETETTIASPAVHRSKGAGGVKETSRAVHVVCKMPRGLLLQLTQVVKQKQRVMGGGIEIVDTPMRVGKQVRLRPTVLPYGAVPNYPIVDGFSITEVEGDFWRSYAQQNENFTMITDGLLRGFDTEQEARAYCREYSKLKHGLEPLSQKDDPRIEKSFNPNVSDIDIDTDSHKVAAV